MPRAVDPWQGALWVLLEPDSGEFLQPQPDTPADLSSKEVPSSLLPAFLAPTSFLSGLWGFSSSGAASHFLTDPKPKHACFIHESLWGIGLIKFTLSEGLKKLYMF